MTTIVVNRLLPIKEFIRQSKKSHYGLHFPGDVLIEFHDEGKLSIRDEGRITEFDLFNVRTAVVQGYQIYLRKVHNMKLSADGIPVAIT